MSKLIWIIDEEWKDYEIETQLLKSSFPDCIIKHSRHDYKDDLEAFGKKADAILAQIYVNLPKTTIDKLENCKVISVYGGGFNRIDLDAVKNKGIIATYVPGYCTEEVSDQVILFIYYFAKKINSYNEPVKKGFWGAQTVDYNNMPKRIKGSILYLIGFGRIAKTVARKAMSLGMEVIAYDPYINVEEMKKMGVKKVEWEEGLKVCDFVSIHTPLTDETKNMIGKKEFELIKKDAVLINVSRGEIIDEKELINAVKNGVIAGAGLDVVVNEPPEPDREIFKCENILVTPHVSYISHESLTELKTRATNNVITALKGQKPKDSIF